MAQFADLSRYELLPLGPKTLNVGWLGAGSDFARQAADPVFLDPLWDLCSVLVYPSRGWHDCELDGCRGVVGTRPPRITRRGMTRELGFAEIRVFGDDGTVYAAPNLVFHYVEAHGYAPPRAFVEAVLEQPRPLDSRYMKLLNEHGVRYWHYGADGSVSIKPLSRD